MKLKRTILGPLLVTAVTIVSGGWLLQQGVSSERSVFVQARIFDEVLQRVSSNYVDEHSQDELYDMAVEGMLRELGDPHTSFLSAEDYDDLRIQTTGDYGGLGIQIDERNGWITVIAPLPGTPAERAGMLPGDRIISVEGESTEGWSSDDAVQVLRGPKGAAVKIQVARVGVDEPIPFEIVRDEIHVSSVRSAYMLEGGVGIVRLDVFSETSTQEVSEAIESMRAEGMTKLILDLRTNPGGLLDQGVAVTDLFVDAGQPVVETRGRDDRDNMIINSSRPEAYPDMPIIVLVNEYSASAAEIVAGALQDHDRALVLGTTTFGKGSVQTLFQLSGGNFLKLTTGRWYTPSGRSIQKSKQALGDPQELIENEPIDEEGVPVPAVDGADVESREEFRTESGRIVYGGGGIVPDVIVQPDTLKQSERDFFQAASKAGNSYQDVLYSYAVEFARSHPDLSLRFPVTEEMRQTLFERLQEAGVAVTAEQFEGATRLIDQQLGYQITMAKFGSAAALQRSNMDDNVVVAAAEMLRRANSQQALFEMAQGRVQAAR